MANRRVLLVDDNESLRFTTSAILEDAGYVVIEAASLAAARAAAASGDFDAAILDVHLGDGLGSELIPELRASHPTTAIIIFSGTSLPGEVPGADLTVVKGHAVQNLVTAVARLIDARRPGS